MSYHAKHYSSSTPPPKRIDVKQRNPYSSSSTKQIYQNQHFQKSHTQNACFTSNTNQKPNVFNKFMSSGPVQAITNPSIDKTLVSCFWFRLVEAVGCFMCVVFGIILFFFSGPSMYKYCFIGVACCFLKICVFDIIGYTMNKTIPCLYTWILFSTLGYLAFITAAGLALLPNHMNWQHFVVLIFGVVTGFIFLIDLIFTCRKAYKESCDENSSTRVGPMSTKTCKIPGDESPQPGTRTGKSGLFMESNQGDAVCCFKQEIRPCCQQQNEENGRCCFNQQIRPCQQQFRQEEKTRDPCCLEHQIPPCYGNLTAQEDNCRDSCCLQQEIHPCYSKQMKSQDYCPETYDEPIYSQPNQNIILCVDEHGHPCYKFKEECMEPPTCPPPPCPQEPTSPNIILCVDECGQPCYKFVTEEKVQTDPFPPTPPPPPPPIDQNIIICIDEHGQPCYKFKENCVKPITPPPLPPPEPKCQHIIICVDEFGQPCYKFVDDQNENRPPTKTIHKDTEKAVLKEQVYNASPQKRAYSPDVSESFSQEKVFSSIPITLSRPKSKTDYDSDRIVKASMQIKQNIRSIKSNYERKLKETPSESPMKKNKESVTKVKSTTSGLPIVDAKKSKMDNAVEKPTTPRTKSPTYKSIESSPTSRRSPTGKRQSAGSAHKEVGFAKRGSDKKSGTKSNEDSLPGMVVKQAISQPTTGKTSTEITTTNYKEHTDEPKEE